MDYARREIGENEIPRAGSAIFQHAVDIYASEINKTAAVWRSFRDDDLGWRPHPRSASVEEILGHELLSGRRFFAEFLGAPEPPAGEVLPHEISIAACVARLVELATPQLAWIAAQPERAWTERVKFFDIERERIWIFWRRVLHSAHHRTQLTVYLRLLGRPVPPVYGPTADATWSGADPTTSIESAGRQ
ncbi:MAG: DinB family protein [Bryobacteraceae bacterium]